MPVRYDPYNAPRLKAFIRRRTRDGVWIVGINCPYCEVVHSHGGGGDAEANLTGHRGQHCDTSAVPAAACMPGYELMPPDSDVDWDAEYERGQQMVREEAARLRAIDEARHEDDIRRMEAVNAQIDRALSIVAAKKETKSEARTAYLAAWTAKRARNTGMGA